MNWEALGSIGEMVAAAGQIVTLIYLVIQVRHNTLSVKANTHQQILNGQLPLWQNRLNFDHAERIYESIGKDALRPAESLSAGSHALMGCRAHQNIFNQVRSGAISAEASNLYVLAKSVAGNPVTQKFWGKDAPEVWSGTKLKDLLSPAYVEFLSPFVMESKTQF